MKLHYRAIEGTNTKTRRLAYLTAILCTLRQGSVSEQLLLNKLTSWSQDHQADLHSYYVHTGEITATRKNSASTHYLDLAAKSKLLVSLAGTYQITRIGSVLTSLMATYPPNSNPFLLNPAEKLFYIYCLLKFDADILLTVVDSLIERNDTSLAYLQQTFKNNLLKRLDSKLLSAHDEVLREQIKNRKIKVKGWEKPERYAEHIVPPRLNWLLDLGFLNPVSFRQQCFEITEEGQKFLSALPCFGEFGLCDITDQWLDSKYWEVVAKALLRIEFPGNWLDIDEERQYTLMRLLLVEAFNLFRSSFVPTISLTQIMLYLSIKLLLKYQIVAGPLLLIQWFSSARIIDGKRYEVRLSPRENESYLIIF